MIHQSWWDLPTGFFSLSELPFFMAGIDPCFFWVSKSWWFCKLRIINNKASWFLFRIPCILFFSERNPQPSGWRFVYGRFTSGIRPQPIEVMSTCISRRSQKKDCNGCIERSLVTVLQTTSGGGTQEDAVDSWGPRLVYNIFFDFWQQKVEATRLLKLPRLFAQKQLECQG